jgi:hypothetical protein
MNARRIVAGAWRRRRSTTLRAIGAVGVVVLGYIFTHQWFARFDAGISRYVLSALGFHVRAIGASGLDVRAGRSFDVTAIVTGSCSSAAGVLGLAAVTFVLLPGSLRRRGLGGLAAAALFVVCNQARIVSIVLVGWWFATSSPSHVLTVLLMLALTAPAGVYLPHKNVLVKIACALLTALCAILAWDVARGSNYLHAMISYHALAGPMLTFATLALGVLVLFRAIVGRDEARKLARAR